MDSGFTTVVFGELKNMETTPLNPKPKTPKPDIPIFLSAEGATVGIPPFPALQKPMGIGGGGEFRFRV